jgi:hypothetical protein
MLENGQDYSLRERWAANLKNSISGIVFICRGQLVQDGTQRNMGGVVKGKEENGVIIQ